MADENTTADPQAGEASDKQPQPQAGTPDPQAGDGLTEHISLADAKKLRSENSNLRTRMKENEALLTELKTFKEQIEASQLSETEKRDRIAQQREKQYTDVQRERDALTLELQEMRVISAIQLHAIQSGIDPKLAQRLLDRTTLEYDDAGHPTNLDGAFKAMIKEFNLTSGKPTAPAPTAGGATSPARSQTDAGGEITAAYVADVLAGRIPWQSLPKERQSAVLAWQAKNPFRF